MSLLCTLLGAYLLPTSMAQSFENPKGFTCGIDPIWILHECETDGNGDFNSWDTDDVLCDRDYDCCYCDGINCADECSSFVISGDYGAAYVDYQIVGADGGVKIECLGMPST